MKDKNRLKKEFLYILQPRPFRYQGNSIITSDKVYILDIIRIYLDKSLGGLH